MSYQTKLKIGAFSQMMQVTVKTLRHFEEDRRDRTSASFAYPASKPTARLAERSQQNE